MSSQQTTSDVLHIVFHQLDDAFRFESYDIQPRTNQIDCTDFVVTFTVNNNKVHLQIVYEPTTCEYYVYRIEPPVRARMLLFRKSRVSLYDTLHLFVRDVISE